MTSPVHKSPKWRNFLYLYTSTVTTRVQIYWKFVLWAIHHFEETNSDGWFFLLFTRKKVTNIFVVIIIIWSLHGDVIKEWFHRESRSTNNLFQFVTLHCWNFLKHNNTIRCNTINAYNRQHTFQTRKITMTLWTSIRSNNTAIQAYFCIQNFSNKSLNTSLQDHQLKQSFIRCWRMIKQFT